MPRPRLAPESRCRHQGAALAFLNDPNRMARFEREALVLASLSHLNRDTAHIVAQSSTEVIETFPDGANQFVWPP